MKFAVALEFEYILPPSNSAEAQYWQRQPGVDKVQATHTYRRSANNALLNQAHQLLNRLEPQDDQEAARLSHWRQRLSDFHADDLAHFVIYQALSSPTLTQQMPTVGLPYAEVIGSYNAHYPIAFRFGPDPYQQGYYDNPGIGEIRTHPMPDADLYRQKVHIINTLGSVAQAFGCTAFIVSSHLHTSAFKEDGQPCLPSPDKDIIPYQQVAAGLEQVFSEAYEPTKSKHRQFIGITPYRGSLIRMIPGRFEHRSSKLLASSLQHMRQGFRRGLTEISRAQASTITTCKLLKLERQVSFNKTLLPDLYLYRLLEHGHLDDQGTIRIKYYDASKDLEKPALTALIGRTPTNSYSEHSTFMAAFFAQCKVDQDGFLSCPEAEFLALLSHLTPIERCGVDITDLSTINAALRKIRVLGNTIAVNHTVQL